MESVAFRDLKINNIVRQLCSLLRNDLVFNRIVESRRRDRFWTFELARKSLCRSNNNIAEVTLNCCCVTICFSIEHSGTESRGRFGSCAFPSSEIGWLNSSRWLSKAAPWRRFNVEAGTIYLAVAQRFVFKLRAGLLAIWQVEREGKAGSRYKCDAFTWP